MRSYFAEKVKNIFGAEFEIMSMERLLGGAQKYTWLVRCSNGFAFVIYQWDADTSYFSNDEKDVFRSNSAELFERNNRFMREHGVLTPKLYYIDRSRSEQPYEYALVEYIDGCDLDAIFAKEPERILAALASLNESIRCLHSIRSAKAGQLGHLLPADFDYITYSLNNIHKDIVYLIDNDPEFAALYSMVANISSDLASRLKPRNEYTFVHFELGPNHVMVNAENNAYLIDIEGARFCDVEEENSFLEIRFGRNSLEIEDTCDMLRMQFYHIGHCIGNLKGAVELRAKGYFDMDDVNGMIDFFHGQIKKLAQQP